MPLIDPRTRYRPIPPSRRRRSKLPPFKHWVILFLVVAGLLSFRTPLLNKYNLLKGLKYWHQDRFELARREFQKVLTRSPGHPRAVDGLGLVEMKEGNLEKAQEYYAQALAAGLTASRRFSHLKTGQAFIDAGRYEEAQIELQHAQALEPENADIQVALGTVLRAQGQVSRAIKAYEAALAQDPKNRRIQMLLEQAKEERDRGSIYYMFDRNGQPLALQWLKNGERGYPMGKEFAHLVGYIDQQEKNNRGAAGLEEAYRKFLPGNRLHLTVDARIQRAIFKAMGWYKGAIVVLHPRTGEVLGALSQPTFTPENIHTDWWSYVSNPNKPLRNRAFEALYEPGSIIKIVTSAAALEKSADLGRIFPVQCNGVQHIDGRPFYCWKRHRRIETLEDAFDSSCNVAYWRVGQALGWDVLYEYNNRFGFNAAPKTLPVSVAVSVTPKLGLNRYQLAEAATGLGEDFKITPLNAALIAAAVANDGVMMSPYVVSKLTNINGRVLASFEPKVFKNAIDRQTARALNTMMVHDVERGIGVKARVEGLKIGGKTGTSGNRDPNFHAWFICFAPAENPKVAMAVVAEHGGTGKDVAAPVARKALEEIREFLDTL